MMLHRHFEKERNLNMTTLADVTPTDRKEFVPEVPPPNVEPVEAPKRRVRQKRTEN